MCSLKFPLSVQATVETPAAIFSFLRSEIRPRQDEEANHNAPAQMRTANVALRQRRAVFRKSGPLPLLQSFALFVYPAHRELPPNHHSSHRLSAKGVPASRVPGTHTQLEIQKA